MLWVHHFFFSLPNVQFSFRPNKWNSNSIRLTTIVFNPSLCVVLNVCNFEYKQIICNLFFVVHFFFFYIFRENSENVINYTIRNGSYIIPHTPVWCRTNRRNIAVYRTVYTLKNRKNYPSHYILCNCNFFSDSMGRSFPCPPLGHLSFLLEK